jgi:CBS domain-containing protein
MATVQHILASKDCRVHFVSPSTTVLEATRLMNHHKIGAVMVMDADRIIGIFTERDVLRRVVAEAVNPAELPVERVMTQELICGQLSTELEEASRIMRDRRIRHLPICDNDGRLLGMVSIGDLNAYYANINEARLSQLNDYVFGRA